MGDFHYPIGGKGKDFRSGKPAFFNKHKKRRHGGGGKYKSAEIKLLCHFQEV